MDTYYYSITFSHRTYTGKVKTCENTPEAAAAYAELLTIDRLVEDYGFDWSEAAKQLETSPHSKTTVSLDPLPGRRPVLINMLTGEKTIGPAGMSEEMLFEMMASH